MDNGVCEKKNSEYFGKPWAEVATERIKKHYDNINICHNDKCKGCEQFGWVCDFENKIHGYFTCRLQNKKCADTHVIAEFISPQHFSESQIVLYDD